MTITPEETRRLLAEAKAGLSAGAFNIGCASVVRRLAAALEQVQAENERLKCRIERIEDDRLKWMEITQKTEAQRDGLLEAAEPFAEIAQGLWQSKASGQWYRDYGNGRRMGVLGVEWGPESFHLFVKLGTVLAALNPQKTESGE